MTMTAFGKETALYTQPIDSLGKFNFILDDSYGPRMRILLTADNPSAKKTKYGVSVDSIRTPKVEYQQKPVVQKLNPIEKAVLAAKEKRDQTKMVFDSLFGVTQLDEVVVTDNRLKPERKETYKEIGEPDFVIHGKDIREKEEKWSYGLYSVLMFNYPGQIEIRKLSNGLEIALIKAGDEPTLIMVDVK